MKTGAGSADVTLAAHGAEVYEVNCAQCHYDGSGRAMMPALRNSLALKEPAARTIHIILHGQQGVSEFEGQKIGGIMPAQPTISDDDIAAVVYYLRAEFAGIQETVTADDVAALR